MTMRRLVLPAVLAASALVFSGCGGGTPAATSPVSGGTFTKAISGDPGSLDPVHAVSPPAREVVSIAYETLVSVNTDGKLGPFLAESWTATSTQATFTLRKDVTCADGSPFDAQLAADNLNFHAVPANATFYFGAQVVEGMKATADPAARTVTVTSPRPDPFLLANTGTIEMLCRKGLADPAALARSTDGTGLYQLTEAVPEDHYRFAKRSGYTWGPGGVTAQTPGLPDAIVLRVIADQGTATNLLLAGELNAAQITGPNQARADGAGLHSVGVKIPTGEMLFNEQQGRVLADPLVREALVTALNRDEIGTVITNGTGSVPTSLITVVPFACVTPAAPWRLPAPDTVKAAALLDRAGWTVGAGGTRSKGGVPLTVKFLYDEGGDTLPEASELVAQTWRQLGVTTELRSMNSAAWNDTLFATGDWDTGFVMIAGGYPSFLPAFFDGKPPSDGGNNFMNVDNPAYDQLVAQAMQAPPDATCPIWNKADAALVERFDVLPVVDSVQRTFGKKATFETNGFVIPTSIRMLG